MYPTTTMLIHSMIEWEFCISKERRKEKKNNTAILLGSLKELFFVAVVLFVLFCFPDTLVLSQPNLSLRIVQSGSAYGYFKY